MSKRQTLTTPISGSPDSFDRAQPPADGVSTSNTGFSSSRIDSTSCPSLQKKCCSARRSPGSNSTVKSRSPARNAGSEMPSSVSGA